MQRSKNFLLLIVVFLYSTAANADVMGGYDRQRLSLLFTEKLHQYFDRHPLTVNLSALPVVLPADSDSAARKLYDILAEEGWLHREVAMSQMQDNDGLAQQVLHYRRVKNRDESVIRMGQVDLLEIDEITDTLAKSNEPPSYQVSFQWQLIQPAPWLWAPTLSTVPYISALLNATREPARGQAVFTWRQQDWQISAVDIQHSTE